MDREKSEYQVDCVLETRENMMSKLYPDCYVYSWIKKFIPHVGIDEHLFRCVETMELVCSGTFMEKAVESGLLGLRFIPIDENYRYDPWGEIE